MNNLATIQNLATNIKLVTGAPVKTGDLLSENSNDELRTIKALVVIYCQVSRIYGLAIKQINGAESLISANVNDCNNASQWD